MLVMSNFPPFVPRLSSREAVPQRRVLIPRTFSSRSHFLGHSRLQFSKRLFVKSGSCRPLGVIFGNVLQAPILPLRPDRSRMGHPQAHAAAPQTPRAQAERGFARNPERDFLRFAHGLPVGLSAARLSAGRHRLWLLQSMEERWHLEPG